MKPFSGSRTVHINVVPTIKLVPKQPRYVGQPVVTTRDTEENSLVVETATQSRNAISKQATPNRDVSRRVSSGKCGCNKSDKKVVDNRRRITRNTQADVEKIKKLKGIGTGRFLVIIGNGPSVSEVTDLSKLKGMSLVDTMSVNKPDPRLWPTTYWSFFDKSQFLRHESLWDTYEGLIFNSMAIKNTKRNSMRFSNKNGTGFSFDASDYIHFGYSSVYASIQIAFWMGYERIFVFGCDMNPEGLNGLLHFYGVNPDVEPEARKKRFVREAESYNFAADNLSEEDLERVYFCTEYNPWEFIKVFNGFSHKTAVSAIEKMCAEELVSKGSQ
jgi:hypothetical protein